MYFFDHGTCVCVQEIYEDKFGCSRWPFSWLGQKEAPGIDIKVRLRLFSEHALKIRANQMLIFRACSENKGRSDAYFQSML